MYCRHKDWTFDSRLRDGDPKCMVTQKCSMESRKITWNRSNLVCIFHYVMLMTTRKC